MSDDTTRRIELSRGKMLWVIALGVLFIAAAAWLASADDEVFLRNGVIPDAQVGHAIGVIGAAFGAIGLLYAVRKLFDRRPGLVLSADGLLDNSSAVAAGFVPWDEVTEIRIWQFQRQRVLVVCVRDAEKYIGRSNRLMQALHRANVGLCGSPIVLSASALKIRFEELEPLVRRYHSRHTGGTA